MQIDVLRGHITNVAYNDVLGHETDSLRTLVVGVKQGLGTITINTVPAGGVEAHELTNYENETYDLWLAEYPTETGTFDAPSNPVSITAVPADGDGHLDYWMGSYFAYNPRDAAELSVILFDDTKLNAIIEGRPGMGALDLVSDFEDFVAEVLPAQDWDGEGEPELPEIAQRLADAFASTDANDGNRLTVNEARAAYPALTTDQFEDLGTSGDGFLSLPELEAQLEDPSGCNAATKVKHSLGDVFLLGAALLTLAGFARSSRRLP